MQGWLWALVLKPIAAVVVFAVVFGVPVLLVYLLRPLFPEGRLKRWLFRERGGHGASGRAYADKSVLDHAPIVSRQRGDDRPSL